MSQEANCPTKIVEDPFPSPGGGQSDRGAAQSGIGRILPGPCNRHYTVRSDPSHSLTDPKDKRRFWERHLEQCRQSGLTQKGYCQEHGLKRHQFYYWKKRLGSACDAVSFLPVDLGGGAPRHVKPIPCERNSMGPPGAGVRILMPNGVVVELDGPVDLSDLLSMAVSL